MKLTYLGTASLLVELGGLVLLTDPALDPAGTTYDFGPWYTPRAWFTSEKTYATPALLPAAIDCVLLSHDHHADNLDLAGRALLASPAVKQVVAPAAAARRLARPAPGGRPSLPGEGLGIGEKVHGLPWGASREIGGGVKVTATPARHGPIGTPRIHEVAGFLVEAAEEPTLWISGDTVMFPALARFLEARKGAVDVAVLHAGGVRFPSLPVLGRSLFTFDGAQLAEAAARLGPSSIVPVHRSGWTHFRDPEAHLEAEIARAGLAERTRWLALGSSWLTGPGEAGTSANVRGVAQSG